MLKGSFGIVAIALIAVLSISVSTQTAQAQTKPKPDFKPFAEVSKGYTKVVSTADGSKSLYGVYLDKKKNQLLAELPSGYSNQKYFFAVTQASGSVFAGLQGPTRYVYWKRYDKRMALISPEVGTRSTGESQSKSSVKRLFTDKVLLDVPIIAMGPGGQPVIDLDDLLIGKASTFLGGRASGVNSRLSRVVSAKAFPKNIEIAIEVPVRGTLATFHYSISLIPDSTGYKPRIADERIGYFTTVYRDLGQYTQEKKWTRYIDRWNLQKRDSKLRLSPPKEPIIFYIEHTVPVRYRRWVRQGLLYWNEAFREIGIDNAIEVRYQDKATNKHMDKDPEDVRYNFIRWLNNDISTAIGPHRSHPLTGQILDADIVLTDGWIRAYWGWYHEQAPELAVEGFSAETLDWLEDHPDWDPRILLSSPAKRQEILAFRQERNRKIAAGEAVPPIPMDSALMLSEELAQIGDWLGEEQRFCLAAHGLAGELAFSRLSLEALGLFEESEADGDDPKTETLDGIPEWFVGPLLAGLVCHEVGHTLGLRHNFKASSAYTLAQINSDEFKGKKPMTGSVMDYNPANFNMESGEIQGDFAMIGIGPYDKWAIEYGYTFGDTKEVLKRVSEPELAYLTDDDTNGPDPFARRYDFSSNPIDYAENQMRLVRYHRERILDKFVKDGQSWSNARRGYKTTLSQQLRMLSMMANWVGGTNVNRDRKGDPGNRQPVTVVDVEKQRAAIKFVIDNAFSDEVFGLTPELLAHMTVDKWSDQSRGDRSDPTWPIHSTVISVQSSALTMLLNPTTLTRVYDNEFRTAADEDALTLPEVMQTITDAVFSEFNADLASATFDDRKPMISSLRRNLQSSMVDRLIGLSSGDRRMPRPISTLATHHLRAINTQVQDVLSKSDGSKVDRYTIAHLEDLKDRITKALNSVYVENK